MSYLYSEHKAYTLTDEGQRTVLSLLDFARRAINLAGAVSGEKLLAAAGPGDSWNLMACYDRLVELGYLYRVKRPHYVPGQAELYVAGDKL